MERPRGVLGRPEAAQELADVCVELMVADVGRDGRAGQAMPAMSTVNAWHRGCSAASRRGTRRSPLRRHRRHRHERHRRGAAQPRLPGHRLRPQGVATTTRRLERLGRQGRRSATAAENVRDARRGGHLLRGAQATTPRCVARAAAADPGHPARRDARRADAPQVRRRRRRQRTARPPPPRWSPRCWRAAGLDPDRRSSAARCNVARLATRGSARASPGGRGRRVRRLASSSSTRPSRWSPTSTPSTWTTTATLEALAAGVRGLRATRCRSTGWSCSASITRTCRRCCRAIEKRVVTYGARAQRGLPARGHPARRASPRRFRAFRRGEALGRVHACRCPGAHNVAQRAGGDRRGGRAGHPVRRRCASALAELRRRAAPLHRARRGAGRHGRRRLRPPPGRDAATLAGARDGRSAAGWSSPSSRTATRARAICSPSSPPPSTTPTC